MVLQGGGEKVFPVQLMTIRRSRNGQARSIFLSNQATDYCSTVFGIFEGSRGSSRKEIEKKLKTMELKSQNPKIIRGLALLMFRLSRMEKTSQLDPLTVRESIFRNCKTPALTVESRNRVLEKVASELNTTSTDIENALYSDLEENEILVEPANITTEELAGKYNMEQVETVMLKSRFMDISTSTTNRNRFVRRIRSLGLLYKEEIGEGRHTLRVSGPVSILEKSYRYGSRFASLIRYILKFTDWEVDAIVNLKSASGKNDFHYHIDYSVSEYTGIQNEQERLIPDFVRQNPEPVNSPSGIFYPDYSVEVGNKRINVFLTTPRYYGDDADELAHLLESGHDLLLCLIMKGEKCPKNARCFKEEVDWLAVRNSIGSSSTKGVEPALSRAESEQKYGNVKEKPVKELNAKVVNHLRALYPDSAAMVDYLEFIGLPPEETLKDAGYKVVWKGLMIMVE